MKWTEIVTAVVALYGAILATVTLINQLRLARPRLKVQVRESYILMMPGTSSDELMVTVTAQNFGLKTVTLNLLGFKFPNEKEIYVPKPLGSVQFPHTLEPETSCTMCTQAKRIADYVHSQGFSGKVRLVGYVRDAVGRVYKSKPLEFDSERWLDTNGAPSGHDRA